METKLNKKKRKLFYNREHNAELQQTEQLSYVVLTDTIAVLVFMTMEINIFNSINNYKYNII